jgi:acyl carrier protein
VTELARAAGHKGESEIQEWLLAYLSALIDVDADRIDINDSFASYGLDSSAGVGMVGDLSHWLNRTLDAELIYRHPTIESLARHLATGGAQ